MPTTPNLFLIGTAKGGSTSFAFHLASHPDITFATQKEPNIFNQPDVAACRARMDQMMQGAGPARYVLDGSVNYSQIPKFQNVPAHIADICGTESPRFLYMIRNPVDRAISQYYWRCERYGEERPLIDAITEDSQYVASGRYDQQIAAYHAQFAPDQLRVVVHDVYFADVPGQFADICRWLDIDDSHMPDAAKVRGATNKTTSRGARFPAVNRLVRASPALRQVVKSLLPHKHQLKLTRALSKDVPRAPVDPETRARLQGLFDDSIARTQDMIGQDLSAWRG